MHVSVCTANNTMNPETAKRYPKNWPEISRATIEDRGNKCEECPCTGERYNPLTTHHIDGRPENCADENLIVLCAKCHLRLQTTGRTLNCWTKQYQLMLFPQ